MKSRLLAGTAAVVLAVVGALLIVSYAQGADQRAVRNLDPVPVLVVETAIPAGTPVESLSDSLAVEHLPAAAVAESALSSLDGSAGKVTAVDLIPGEQLVTERLVAAEDREVPGGVDVPAGLQELTIELDPMRVVGGRLNPGDHVGIFMSFENGADKANPEDATSQLTVRKVLVTGIQRAPQVADGEQTADSTIPTGTLMLTLAVNDVDAGKIVFASEFGRLWLTKEPLDAPDNGPKVERKEVVYK